MNITNYQQQKNDGLRPQKSGQHKNYTLYVYSAGSVIDKDIKYNLNGSEIFLPEGKAYIAAVAISVSKETGEISEVYGIYFMNQKTYQIPLRYYYSQKDGFVDTGKGLHRRSVACDVEKYGS
jgi:hypothetical protein